MKIIKKTSLVLGFCIWTLLVAIISFGTGSVYEYNRLIWVQISSGSPIGAVPKNEQIPLYLELRKSCLLKTQGDKIAETNKGL